MTKQDILNNFSDINFMYNNCSKLQELNNYLDEYRNSIIIDMLKSQFKELDSNSIETIVTEAVRDNKDVSWVEIIKL